MIKIAMTFMYVHPGFDVIKNGSLCRLFIH